MCTLQLDSLLDARRIMALILRSRRVNIFHVPVAIRFFGPALLIVLAVLIDALPRARMSILVYFQVIKPSELLIALTTGVYNGSHGLCTMLTRRLARRKKGRR